MRKKNFRSNQKKGKTKSVVLSPQIIEMIDKYTETVGCSISEFIKNCVREKLERLSLISTQIKEEI